MRTAMIWPVVLLAMAGTACSKSENGRASQQAAADSAIHRPIEPKDKVIRQLPVTEKPSIEEMVRIEFTQASYNFRLNDAAQGIQIDYKVVVDKDVPNVISKAQDIGSCMLPDSSGLIIFEKLTGNGQSYGLFDRGLGQPQPTPMTIKKGVYPHTFQWDGKNWGGPSDYSVPKGPPFPPGVYTLCVSAIGKQDENGKHQSFRIEANVPITLKK